MVEIAVKLVQLRMALGRDGRDPTYRGALDGGGYRHPPPRRGG